MSPAPVASTAQVPGKDVRWLGGVHGADTPRRAPKEMHLPNPRGETGWREGTDGEVAEWLKAHAWKVCLRETVTRVRIPLSPPAFQSLIDLGVSHKRSKGLRPRGYPQGLKGNDPLRYELALHDAHPGA